MHAWIFLLTAAALFALLIGLGWRYLPEERFQMLATVPGRRRRDGSWQGINFTWYGLVLASAATIGVLFVLLLMQAAGMALTPSLCLLAMIVAVGLPAARLVARRVEHKQYTFTIGGAFFCGLLATPLLILLVNAVCVLAAAPSLHLGASLAALSIGSILGEGLGRLACLSFGCCYGKALPQCGRLLNLLFDRLAVIFTGPAKKAVYEGGLAGVKLVPIQGLTCLLYTACALVASGFYLHGRFRAAFMLCLLVSQIWRVLSEMLRADFRGFGAISAYQQMSVLAVLYGALLSLFFPAASHTPPDIVLGLRLLLDTAMILGLKLFWCALFLHFGRSMVTGATLSYEVHLDRV